MYLYTHKLVIFPSDAILKGQRIREFGYAKQWIIRTMILKGKLRMQKRGVFYFIILFNYLHIYLLIYLFIRLFILLDFQIRLAFFCFVFLFVFVFKLMWLKTIVLTFANISGFYIFQYIPVFIYLS